MVLRKAVLLLAVAAITTATAHAQFGVYGTFTVDRLSNLKSSPDIQSTQAVNNSVAPLGGTGGVYYDFKQLGPVKLGADVRGTIVTTKRGAYTNFNAGGARIYSGLAGVRAVFHTPLAPLKPYLQVSAGVGRSDYGLIYNPPSLRTDFQYEGFAGLDIHLLPIMDVRLLELGYGGHSDLGTNSHNYPVGSVSTGIVFHLPF